MNVRFTMKRKLVVVLLILSVLPAGAVWAHKLTFYTEDWPPFNFTDKAGLVTGYSVELVNAACKLAGIECKIQRVPWARGYHETLTNENTALFTTARLAQREPLFKWVGPLYQKQTVLYKLKSRKDIKVNNIEDLKAYKIGVVLGGSTDQYLRTQGFAKELDLTTTDAQNIQMFLLGRFDLLPGEPLITALNMKDMAYKFSDLEVAFVLIDEGVYSIAVNKDTSDEMVNKLQQGLDRVVKDGLKEKLAAKYFK